MMRGITIGGGLMVSDAELFHIGKVTQKFPMGVL